MSQDIRESMVAAGVLVPAVEAQAQRDHRAQATAAVALDEAGLLNAARAIVASMSRDSAAAVALDGLCDHRVGAAILGLLQIVPDFDSGKYDTDDGDRWV